MTLDELQGGWTITELEIDGESMPAAGRITIKGGRFTTASMGAEYKGNVSVDGPNIDLHFTSGPEKGNTSLGIFKLKGDDLQFCLTLTAKERPKRFQTSPGSGLALEKLRRDAGKIAKAAKVSIPEKLIPVPALDGEWAMVECMMGSKPLPANYVKTGRRSTANNEFRVTVDGQTILHAHYNPVGPGDIDYYVHCPGKKVSLQFGIWKREGDKLTTCIAGEGTARPEKLEPGPGRTYSVWRKIG